MGTDIKLKMLHGSTRFVVDAQLTGQQTLQLHAKGLGQVGEQGNVRTTHASFPLGDGFVADSQPNRQLQLCQTLL